MNQVLYIKTKLYPQVGEDLRLIPAKNCEELCAEKIPVQVRTDGHIFLSLVRKLKVLYSLLQISVEFRRQSVDPRGLFGLLVFGQSGVWFQRG